MPFVGSQWNPRLQSKMNRWRNRMAKKPSPIERKVKRYLEDLGQDFIFQEIIGKYIVDFVDLKRKLIIECDGEAFHSTAKHKQKDSIRDFDLKRQGFKILRLLGWQCWNEPVCKGLIIDFLKAAPGDTSPAQEGFQAIDDCGGPVNQGPSLSSKESV